MRFTDSNLETISVACTAGLIVDTERGLVVVDRNTVPVAMGDVSLTFAGSLEIPGRVLFIHPLHNFSVVSYEPALIGDTQVKAARFSKREVAAGDPVWAVGLKGDHKLAVQATEVASVDSLILPLSRTMRCTDSNLETISVVNSLDAADSATVRLTLST